MRTVCPFCHVLVGCYIPRGGDGSAARLRKHERVVNEARELCSGSFHTTEDWEEAPKKRTGNEFGKWLNIIGNMPNRGKR